MPNISNGTMFGDLNWTLKRAVRFVNDSWVSCIYYSVIVIIVLKQRSLWNLQKIAIWSKLLFTVKTLFALPKVVWQQRTGEVGIFVKYHSIWTLSIKNYQIWLIFHCYFKNNKARCIWDTVDENVMQCLKYGWLHLCGMTGHCMILTGI